MCLAIAQLLQLLNMGFLRDLSWGALLFLIYINDLPPNAIQHSEPTLFADDTNLLFSSKNLQVLEQSVNQDLVFLLNWLYANKIALNATKTEAILFRDSRKPILYNVNLQLCGQALEFSSNVRYPGIILDEFLSWTVHHNALASKLQRANGVISKLRHFLPLESMISIYHALFNSHLSYAAQIWGQNLPTTSRLSKLQKTAIQLITFLNLKNLNLK